MTYAPPPTDQYAPPPAGPKASGLAVGALIVGIGAFVFGLVPFFGILIAITGIILGALALRKPGPKTLAVIGLILSIVAAIANIIAIVITVALLPAYFNDRDTGSNDYDYSVSDDDEEEAEEDVEEEETADELFLSSSTTPCFSFDAPQEFIANQSPDKDALCFGTRQGWGELDDDGTIIYTGVGDIWDQVLVEPIRVVTSDTYAPDGELDTFVDYLDANYFPDLGEVISLHEEVTLDGVEANLTRIDSPAETTVTKATIAVKAEQPYETANGPVQFFLITFVIDDERGDEIIDALVDSWEWN